MDNAISADVIVVGSGVAGLSSALTAAEAGAKVMVFEKRRSLGGTSNFFHGIFAAESYMQRAKFITYTRDEAFKAIMEYSHWRANPHLVRTIVDESAATIVWLEKQGVQFVDVVNNLLDAPRTYHVVKGGGRAIVRTLAARARAEGVTVSQSAPVKQIVRDGGVIAGAVVHKDGKDIQVSAKAVVVASGGYLNNEEWVKKYAGLDVGVNVMPVGNVGKTGDGIRMAFDAGADHMGLGMLELFRVGPVGPGYATKTPVEYVSVQPDLWVDQQGKRLCDESIGFYETSIGNASSRNRESCNFSIFDSGVVKRLMENGIDKAHVIEFPPGSLLPDLEKALAAELERGSAEAFEAGSIRELAGKIGVDPETLEQTVEQYNTFCDKGHDDLFAKDPKYLRPLRGPRFYAIRARTVCLGTMGGIKINEKCEAVDPANKVIPGLYAAGYDAGGMYGDSYPIRPSSGLSAGFAINSGRIAGRNASRSL